MSSFGMDTDFNLCAIIYIYIYIYIYTHTYTVYVYIYTLLMHIYTIHVCMLYLLNDFPFLAHVT